MTGFVHTLTAQPTVLGPVTFTVIDKQGSRVTTGVITYLFEEDRVSQVQVIDASNVDGSFAFRIIYHQQTAVDVPLIDIVAPSAGEVLKSFAVEAPLLEVAGDGVRGLTATALALGGTTPRANLTIIVIEIQDSRGVASATSG
jgi:hypothetical protein